MSSELCLPDDFRTVWGQGLLSLEKGIRLSDIRWMSPAAIAAFQRPSFLSESLVPFALTAGHSRFGWWKNANGKEYQFVVFSPADCDEAVIYAPDFTGFLYRAILEDMADCWGSWLGDNAETDAVEQMVRTNVNLASPFLPESWARTLREIALRRPSVTATGSLSWVDPREVQRLTRTCFGALPVDATIVQYR